MDKEVGWWVALARMGAAQWEMGAVGEHPSSELNAKASVCVFFSAWWGAVSYTHLTLPTIHVLCRSRWSPYH